MCEFVLWQSGFFMDSEFAEIGLRFLLNLIVITLLVKFIYLSQKNDKTYGFTFFLFNILIFFVCYLMLKVEISMGFAFGLFAIFGILRYRTNTIPIKEMTYLFTAITLALINAISPIEWTMVFMDVCIIAFIFLMERLWFSSKEQSKTITYEKIKLIEEGKHDEIVEDLRKRTGLNITRFEIRNMNLVNDSASLKAFYIP